MSSKSMAMTRKPSRMPSQPRRVSDKPSLIACKTLIGKGAPNLQGSEKTHGAPLGDAEIAATRANIGWSHAPFEVPDADRRRLARCRRARPVGASRLGKAAGGLAAAPRLRGCDCRRPAEGGCRASLDAFRKEHVEKATKVATRKASEMALGAINAATDLTVGGSADLTHSNLTLTKDMGRIAPGDYAGRYIHYGIREHGMAAAMNGIALHGGFIPYGGTFLCFTDYARGAMRLSALMGQRVIYVMTHDSIGLGEDGPTHQPIEHLAMLRATPNIDVYRPADIIETAEVLGAGAAIHGPAERAGAVAPEPADAAAGAHSDKPFGARRLSSARTSGQARRHADRHRIGGGDRRHCRRAVGGAGHRRGGRLDAVLGAVRGAGSEATAPMCWARRHASPSRRRPAWAGTAGSARTAPSSA